MRLEHEIDHGAVSVERRRAPQRKRNDVLSGRRTARHGHGDVGRLAAGLGVAQLDRALAVTDRFVGFAGIEMRHFERVEHGEVFAVPHDIVQGLRDRLIIALHVRQRRDQRLLQAGDVGLAARQFLGQRQRRQPIALLKERVEQQFLGDEIVRPERPGSRIIDDRFVVLAGAQQRADVVVELRRDLRRRRACGVGHRQFRALGSGWYIIPRHRRA